ncbi:MAG: hypothetical protein J0H25_01965 [Rhizobiales bacterium]|nr:hypothetical protein [Hyphomicrobiales bacterium]
MIVTRRILSDQKSGEERLDDLSAACAFFLGRLQRNELLLASEASPELLNLVGIEALFPIEMDHT